MLLASASARAELLLTENFDDISTLAGKGWTLSNQSTPAAGATGWFQGEAGFFPANSGAGSSYIAANFLNATYGGNISNWLVLPELTVRPGAVLSFYTRTDTSGWPGDMLTVKMTAGLNPPVDLTVIGSATGSTYPSGWTRFSVSVGTAVPTSVRIALVYSVTDTSIYGNYIGIDDVSVSAPTSVPEPGVWMTVSLTLLAAGSLKRRFKALATTEEI